MSQGIFKQQNYKDITLGSQLDGGTAAGHLSPATTDGLANQAEAVLSFFHVPSETDVFFKAFITTFSENYSSDWTPDTVFGRTDPIYTFKNTTRNISLGWKIPADTISEAYENLGKVQKLAQFLYPSYAAIDENINTLSQSPLVRLKLMNLIQGSNERSQTKNSDSPKAKALLDQYISANNPSQGLLGAITSLTVNHNLENAAAGVIQKGTNTILPKLIEVSIDFKVIHESVLGWNKENNFMDQSFPYNAVLEEETYDTKPGSYNERIAARQARENDRIAAEQDRANAIARGYNGMFGEKRVEKDIKRLERLTEKKKAGETLSERQQNNLDYLESALLGYVAGGGDISSYID